jgi:hypothetical protein
VLWILIALVLAIPAWLGITRSGTETDARRWVGRCLVWGIGIGAVFSGMMWLSSVHVPTSTNLLWGPLIGASAGATFGLVSAALWLLVARWWKGRSDSPSV